MKYAIIIPDGAADDPLPELNGKTPLEAARTPNMDRIATEGRIGLVAFGRSSAHADELQRRVREVIGELALART